jgi:hypothetical protein
MRSFRIAQSSSETLTSRSGLALVGLALKRLTGFVKDVATIPQRHEIGRGFKPGHSSLPARLQTPPLTNTAHYYCTPSNTIVFISPLLALAGRRRDRRTWGGQVRWAGKARGRPGVSSNGARAGGRTSGTRRLMSRALRRRPSNGDSPPGAKRQEAGAQTPAPSARHQRKSPRRGRRVAALHFTICGRAALASPLTVPAAVPGEGTRLSVSCNDRRLAFETNSWRGEVSPCG